MTDAATLRADLAAMERRAALAEADWNRLLAEVVTVRRALDGVARGVICSGSGPIAPCFDADDYAVERARGQWSAVDGKAIQRVRDALTATPHAAALGTLVEAALAWHESLGKPTKEQIHYICNTSEKGLAVLYACAAAEAVLAALGKEGA